MYQIKPQQPYPIVRQLEDPTDVSTNYVQAVVRNSLTGIVLATINLKDKGGQRFMGNFTPPADTTGLGYYIDITTTVYTENTYTTKNPNYGIIDDSYLVLQPVTLGMGQGTGGGIESIDYKKIEKLIKGIEFPEYETYDYGPKFLEIGKILAKVLSNFERELVDLKPVFKEMQTLKALVQAIEIPEPLEPEKVDLFPLIEGIQNVAESLGKFEDNVGEKIGDVYKYFDGREVDVSGQLEKFLGSIPEESSHAMSGLLMFGSKLKRDQDEIQKKPEKKERVIEEKINNLFPANV